MHREDKFINLKDVVEYVPDNDWLWSMFEFRGVGIAPNGDAMGTFENYVSSLPEGYSFTWNEFRNFSFKIEQVFDLLIIATENDTRLNYEEIDFDNLSCCEVVIQAIDSTKWIVDIKNDLVLKMF